MKNIIDQMTEPRFKQMMVKLSKATTEKEVDDIINEHNQIEMSEAEKQQYSDNVIADLENVLKALDDDIEELRAARIREKMGDLDQAISFAYIAKNYFGKSYSWLAQRLNGSKVNGKEAHFNREEVLQLQSALNDLGKKLSSIVLL
jgi:hypothetical protein